MELIALLEGADPRRRPRWGIGAGQGLRPSELVRVHWEDIGWNARTMVVRGTKTDDSWDRRVRQPGAPRLVGEEPETGWAFT